jgi:hypothetical protein
MSFIFPCETPSLSVRQKLYVDVDTVTRDSADEFLSDTGHLMNKTITRLPKE